MIFSKLFGGAKPGPDWPSVSTQVDEYGLQNNGKVYFDYVIQAAGSYFSGKWEHQFKHQWQAERFFELLYDQRPQIVVRYKTDNPEISTVDEASLAPLLDDAQTNRPTKRYPDDYQELN